MTRWGYLPENGLDNSIELNTPLVEDLRKIGTLDKDIYSLCDKPNLENQIEGLCTLKFTLPHGGDFSKIFHKGCRDFKWNSPIWV